MNNINLREIVFSSKYEKANVETMIIGGIVIPLIQINKYKVYLYGVESKLALPYIKYLRSNDIDVCGIIDIDLTKSGVECCEGIKYIHTSELNRLNEKDNIYVIIITSHYEGISGYNISKVLLDAGINRYYYLPWDSDEKLQILPYSPMSIDVETYFREKINELEETYSLLGDELSKRVMIEYLRAVCLHNVCALTECDGRRKYLYGGARGEKKEELYRHLENEVWVNCGSNIGDSIFMYFSQGLTAERIYAFEGVPNICRKLRANVSELPEHIQNKISIINEFISTDTDFEKYIQYPVTFLNADIEGAELEMLKAMKNIIQRDRPVISVCMYHRKEDFVEIPRYISSIVDDYVYLLRKYESDWMGDIGHFWEIVLYAIPKQRWYSDMD